MALGSLIRGRSAETRDGSYSFDQYLELITTQFAFNGIRYLAPSGNFSELTALQGMRNPIVAACVSTRMLVFAEAKFAWQPFTAGRPGNLFGNRDLDVLERPWPTGTTVDLLARMEVDASYYGNSYWVRDGAGLTRLDPCDVVIIDADIGGYGRQLLGYAVTDDGGKPVKTWNADEVAHYRPLPDPSHPFRGRSWLDAILPDVTADTELTRYKTSFMKNAATPNLAVSLDPGVSPAAFDLFVEKMNAQHAGTGNAFKTLYLGGGADVKVVGANFEQLNLKNVQGAIETRVASAAGVPASIVGLSESMQGSSLNAGNYSAARRRFSDGTIRPLWRAAAGALETLVRVPSGSRLWFDDRDIPFCQEDVLDAAEIESRRAMTVESYVRAGFTPESAVEAVRTGDMGLLKHTGLYSVQLQPPGTTQQALPPSPPQGG